MRTTGLDITALADAILADTLFLSQHIEYAGAPWLEPCLNTIQDICREQPELTETKSAVQPFTDYFIGVSDGVSSESERQVVAMVTSAINCGYYISHTETNRSWTRKPELPSPEAETLLAVTSEALEREIQRKWNDAHTGKLRTVALMYGYLIGRRGVGEIGRSMKGKYHDCWIFVPT